MAVIQNFKELLSWQKARTLTQEIYRASRAGALGRDFEVKDQIRRAAVSVMSNIAEGFERKNPGERIYLLNVARGSLAEVRSLLCVCEDEGYLTVEAAAGLDEMAAEIARLITGLMNRIETKQLAGKNLPPANHPLPFTEH